MEKQVEYEAKVTGETVAALLPQCAIAVDHVAIAVEDLEAALSWYTGVLGFSVTERRTTEGRVSGMHSAVLNAGSLTLVLLQGTSSESQVAKYIQKFGPGVQHIAFSVSDLGKVVENLKQRGMEFDTTIVGSGSLRQIFSRREQHSGMMFELLERSEAGFAEQNVSGLFEQLEAKGNC